MTLFQKSPTSGSTASLRQIMVAFGQKMRRIHKMNAEIGSRLLMEPKKPSFWLKLDNWLGQLCNLKRKEERVLSRIKDVEVMHKQLRMKKQLKMARSRKFTMEGPKPGQGGANRQKALWLFLLALYMAMRTRKTPRLPTLTNG